MPKDFFVFLLIIAALIGLRFLPVSSGIRLFLFSIIVISQVAFLLQGFLRNRPPKKG